MDWKQISDAVGRASPALGVLLGGPAGGLVGTAVAAALGVQGTPDAVSAAVASDPEAAVKLRQIEADAVIRAQQLENERHATELADVKSAREREASVRDVTNRVLAYSVIGAFIAMVGATLLGAAKVDGALAGTLVGYLSAKAEQVLAYYFGSTAGSARKTELLAQSAPVGNG